MTFNVMNLCFCFQRVYDEDVTHEDDKEKDTKEKVKSIFYKYWLMLA